MDRCSLCRLYGNDFKSVARKGEKKFKKKVLSLKHIWFLLGLKQARGCWWNMQRQPFFEKIENMGR